MDRRHIMASVIGTLLLLVMVILLLRAFNRRAVAGVQASGEAEPVILMEPCTAESSSGHCFPNDDAPEPPPFDEAVFQAMVREENRRMFEEERDRQDEEDRLQREEEERRENQEQQEDVVPEPVAPQEEITSQEFTEESGDAGVASDEPQDSEPADDGNPVINRGGDDGFRGDGGLQGSVGPLPSGRCLRGRSLLSIFDLGELSTGTMDVTYPVLIDGDCPTYAAMIRVNKTNPFGGPLDDF